MLTIRRSISDMDASCGDGRPRREIVQISLRRQWMRSQRIDLECA
jgi:hypothetical protein